MSDVPHPYYESDGARARERMRGRGPVPEDFIALKSRWRFRGDVLDFHSQTAGMVPIENATNWRPTLPVNWRLIDGDEWGRAWQHNGLRLIETAARERDCRVWLHVSFSRASRLPDYEDSELVRRLFIGEDRESYAVFPPRERWVNRHQYCLHLWTCLDEPNGVLPDFRHQGEI